MIKKATSIIFDCDGVILNSNKVKLEAYYKIASLHYGDKLATSLIDYLSSNTGKTREYFFNHFINHMVPKGLSGPNAQSLLAEVSKEIKVGLVNCEISHSLLTLREKFSNSKWFVVSGGVEKEIIEVFKERSVFQIFDGGVFGGPRAKDEIFKSLIDNEQIKWPAVYLGDSKFDYEVAKRFNLDFIFINGWTEFKHWESYCVKNKIKFIESLTKLL